MFRCRASISIVSAAASTSGSSVTRAFKYGLVPTTSSNRTRATPCTMIRRLPSGSLNILWMWLAVPTFWRSPCFGSSSAGSVWAKTAIMRPAVTASSMRRTELSRATASGMKAWGNSTVSRSGRMASSPGTGGAGRSDGSDGRDSV